MVPGETVSVSKPRYLRRSLMRIAREMAELPVASRVSEPIYRRYFRQPHQGGNLYFGVFNTYDEALDEARALSTSGLPSTYDLESATHKYLDQLQTLRTCDYPALFWVSQLLNAGVRRVFDLGGHLGLAYYGYGGYLSYPDNLSWCVHDLPHVMAAGKTLASERDKAGALQFCDSPTGADGCDLLISSGALQYLDYRLTDLIDQLEQPPPHVLFNLTPLHPQRSFFTLQNLGIAVCPYRVESEVGLIADMAARGYRVRDHWIVDDRYMRIPFQPGYEVDCYSGYYFEREPSP